MRELGRRNRVEGVGSREKNIFQLSTINYQLSTIYYGTLS